MIREALKENYHGAIAMLVDCIERCPEDLWSTPNPAHDDTDRMIFRAFWRIAFHGIYFTHLYMPQSVEQFQRPPTSLAVGARADMQGIWGPEWELEPLELPEHTEPVSKVDMLAYYKFVNDLVDPTIDGLDLTAQESGVPWYKNFPKVSHEILTIRHLQGHVGQLSELLMARDLESRWISRA